MIETIGLFWVVCSISVALGLFKAINFMGYDGVKHYVMKDIKSVNFEVALSIAVALGPIIVIGFIVDKLVKN